MKKLNKKGFTLAELLIVIAIIAILIAIAIPVFAGQLDNAKLQTDHANIRSAYAQAQVANLEGVLYVGADGTRTELTGSEKFTFQQDGSLALNAGTSPYRLKTDGTVDKCSTSAACMEGIAASSPGTTASNHTQDDYIVIVKGTKGWHVDLAASVTP